MTTGLSGRAGKSENPAREVREPADIPSDPLLDAVATSNTDEDYSDHPKISDNSTKSPYKPVLTVIKVATHNGDDVNIPKVTEGTLGKDSTIPGTVEENDHHFENTVFAYGVHHEPDVTYKGEPSRYTKSRAFGSYNASNVSVVPVVLTHLGVDVELRCGGSDVPSGVYRCPESSGKHKGAIPADDHVYYLVESKAITDVVTETGHYSARVAP